MGFGNGMAIGWPNATYQSGIPNLTAYIPGNLNLELDGEYTLRWWARGINPNLNNEYNVFFSCSDDLNIHSAYLVNTGTFGSPAYRFIYTVNNITKIDESVPEIVAQQWNFFQIERAVGVGFDRIYFSINGVWRSSLAGTPGIVNPSTYPLFIGSNGIGNILNGAITNFQWQRGLINDPGIDFTVPESNFAPNGGTVLLIGIGTNLTELKTDLSGNNPNVIAGTNCSYEAVDPWGDSSTGSFLFQ